MVYYKSYWLAKNSDAYEMWQRKDYQKLDKHLKEIEQKEKELLNRYKDNHETKT